MRYKNIGAPQKAFILSQEGKFMIMRRTQTAPSDPQKWDLPGGAIEIGGKKNLQSLYKYVDRKYCIIRIWAKGIQIQQGCC